MIGSECFHCANRVALPEDFGRVMLSLEFGGDIWKSVAVGRQNVLHMNQTVFSFWNHVEHLLVSGDIPFSF